MTRRGLGVSDHVDNFVDRWRAAAASERANYQLFLSELCDLLAVPRPEPATGAAERDSYVFDKPVARPLPDGTQAVGFIDLYKAGCFVLEAKQGANPEGPAARHGHGRRGSHGWDTALERAYNQAAGYIRDLPAAAGRPPFLIVCDVGHVIELYSEFSRTGGAYVRFPDPQHHRIYLDDLRRPEIRARLAAVWTAPLDLDPARRAAAVTRDVAARLAELARALEADGHAAAVIAPFIQRCLFTLFAEDVGLLPKGGFQTLLQDALEQPQGFPAMAGQLWREMADGVVFSPLLKCAVPYFNGGLFDDTTALPLGRSQLGLLHAAAQADWAAVEPAIFGTLLERALDPRERHRLGAHYTPRAYVERLVQPVVIQPLREEWDAIRAAAAQLCAQGRETAARAAVEQFHRRLCELRILDPACGSGNFLYVTLELLKRLEGEVLDLFEQLGGNSFLELAGYRIRPEQFHGLEINPRAVAIAQLVLWIGYFQWHYRATGRANTGDRPLLPKQKTILEQDAVLAYAAKTPRRTASATAELSTTPCFLPPDFPTLLRHKPKSASGGNPEPRTLNPPAAGIVPPHPPSTPGRGDGGEGIVTIWDGTTTKTHPVTGREVPDDTARVPVYDYLRPTRPAWPAADFIVGNPPFLGKGEKMRTALGDGYVEALRTAWRHAVPDSADFVMYWWRQAAELLAAGRVRRFGFITTNSIHQTFNRRVIEPFLADSGNPIHLAFAIPDHPWVDAADGAAVRIAMTVAAPGQAPGTLATVVEETEAANGETDVVLAACTTAIAANLRGGADLTACGPLAANGGMSSMGMLLAGSGFIVTADEAAALGLGTVAGVGHLVRRYRNGKDLTDRPREVMVIDAYGLGEAEFRQRFPAAYQHVLTTVKPKRDQNNRASYRDKWWLFAENRSTFRPALTDLSRYIATVETSKHRFFTFLDQSILPAHKLVVIAHDDAWLLGVLSSAIHVRWALIAGGRLGVGNDPVYAKTKCFETFPFPAATEAQMACIRELGERLDGLRRAQQAAHPELTLTGLYNVLAKVRSSQPLTAAERRLHDDGLVSLLKQLHDELDAAVLAAYGWSDLEGEAGLQAAPSPLADRLAAGDEAAERLEQELLARLVELNRQRATEEADGHIRWLRPAYQAPAAAGKGEPAPDAAQPDRAAPPLPTLGLPEASPVAESATPGAAVGWPSELAAQFAIVRRLLAETAGGVADSATAAATVAARLTGRGTPKRRAQIEAIIHTLRSLGQ